MKRMHHYLWVFKSGVRLCVILLIQLYVIPTYILWMGFVLFPLRCFNSKLYWKIEGVMVQMMASVIADWISQSGYDIVEIGDDLSPCFNQQSLIISNHQSTADVPLLLSVLTKTNEGIMSSAMFIISNIFKFTNFGLVCWIRGDYFITQGKNVRESQLQELRSHLEANFAESGKKWIILFPEGGFLSKRRETSLQYAMKNGYRKMFNVTLPRIGAMDTIIQTLSKSNVGDDNRLKWLIDLTIAYPNGDPLHITSGFTLTPRPPRQTYFYFRRYSISEVPTSNQDELKQWLFERWSEKEDILEKYYKSGKFECSTEKLLKPMSAIKSMAIHCFFISLTLISALTMAALWVNIFGSNGNTETLMLTVQNELNWHKECYNS